MNLVFFCKLPLFFFVYPTNPTHYNIYSTRYCSMAAACTGSQSSCKFEFHSFYDIAT